MPAPSKIRILAPHPFQGQTMTRHEGQPYILRLGAGNTVTIWTGDYTSATNHLPNSFVESNPTTWEPCL